MYELETGRNFDLEIGSSLATIARNTYGIIALGVISGKMDLVNTELRSTANAVARALTISCFGESRYSLGCVLTELLARSPKPEELRKRWEHGDGLIGRTALAMCLSDPRSRGITIYPHGGVVGRDAVNINAIKDMGLTVRQMAHVSRTILISSLRLLRGEQPGYAGTLWAYGADLVVRYWTGKLSPMMFLDHVFNLVHNGGQLLNKVYYSSGLSPFLNTRRHATPESVATLVEPEYALRVFDVDTSAFEPFELNKYGSLPPSVNKTTARRALHLKKWYRAHYPTDGYHQSGKSNNYRPPMDAAHRKLAKQIAALHKKEKALAA